MFFQDKPVAGFSKISPALDDQEFERRCALETLFPDQQRWLIECAVKTTKSELDAIDYILDFMEHKEFEKRNSSKYL